MPVFGGRKNAGIRKISVRNAGKNFALFALVGNTALWLIFMLYLLMVLTDVVLNDFEQ